MKDQPAAKRESPYQGLVPFDRADAPFFFGREKESRLIAANMSASPLTLLYGASGVGKSSLLRAGVINYIGTRDDLEAVIFSSWQGEPVGEVKSAVLGTVTGATPDKRFKSTKSESLVEFLPRIAEAAGRRLMIILDQFEEYFLYHQNPTDVFAKQFAEAVTKEHGAYSFLISIREDSLAKLDRFQGSIPSLFDNYLRVEHLDRKAARVAIEKPIRMYNELYPDEGAPRDIEGDLVNAVLDQVQTGHVLFGDARGGVEEGASLKGEIETPFLQLVMSRLWSETVRTSSPVLRLKTLKNLGGARRIVRTHLDVALSTLTAEEQDLAAEVFNLLVTPGGAKIAHTAGDLAGYTRVSITNLRRVLEKLSAGGVRVLRPVASAGERRDEVRYEIYHDVLAGAVLSWRRRHLEMREKAEANKTIEELTEVIQETEFGRNVGVPRGAKAKYPPLHNLWPYIERETIRRYLNNHWVDARSVLPQLKFNYELRDPDPFMERRITFDAFWAEDVKEYYLEVANSSMSPFQLADRLYVRLSKLYARRNTADVNTQLILLLMELPDEVRNVKILPRGNEAKLVKLFQPASELELLAIETIVFTVEDYREFERQYFEDKGRS